MYLYEQFKILCDKKRIVMQVIILGTPQQDGVAQRRNRVLLVMIRKIMSMINLSIY